MAQPPLWRATESRPAAAAACSSSRRPSGAVGTALSGRPPLRSVRAKLSHTAPTSGNGVDLTLASICSWLLPGTVSRSRSFRHNPLGFRPYLPAFGGCLRLFAGTTPSSDFPAAYMAVLRREPSPPVPRWFPSLGTAWISRFPHVELLGMLRFSDTAGAPDDSRYRHRSCSLPHHTTRSAPGNIDFGAQWLACPSRCERFTSHLAGSLRWVLGSTC